MLYYILRKVRQLHRKPVNENRDENLENKDHWIKFEELLWPSIKLRKQQSSGRRQLLNQSGATWELCP